MTRSRWVLGLAMVVGCGGSSSGGLFTTSVPSGTKLTALTPAQAAQLCTSLTSYEGRIGKPTEVCTTQGLSAAATLEESTTPAPTDAQLQAACTSAYDSCLSADAGTGASDSCDPAGFSDEPSTCTATVGDLTTCFNDFGAVVEKYEASLPSCAGLTAASLNAAVSGGSDGGGLAEPASCTKFDSTCDLTSNSTNAHKSLLGVRSR